MQIVFLFFPSLNGSVVLALHLCVNLLFSFAFSCFSVFPAGFVVCIYCFFFCSASFLAPVMLFSSSCIYADAFLLRVCSLIAFFLFLSRSPESVKTRTSAAPSGGAGVLPPLAAKRSDDEDYFTASLMVSEDLSADFWLNN